jgi:hypothetical protein
MLVDLPVWTVRPNWAQGILERLEWLTDVLASDTGAEQRRAVRLTPRRSFEITVNPTRAERTYLDLMLHRLGSESWYFPLWHDQATLTADASAHTFRLAIDNTFREHQDGGLALLFRSTFEWDVVQIASQDDTGLDLANPGNSDKAWPKGTKVYPLRVATLQTDTSMKAITSRVGESVLQFTVNEANPYPEMSGGAMVMYDGSPILTLAPNRSEEITSDHTRLTDEADGEVGLRYRLDSADRAFAVQSHNWQIKGREAHADFRSFLYTLNGRQKMVWLPSFNDDLFLARPVAAAATRADIENIGLKYVGGSSPIPGRATFWTGQEVVKHAGFSTPLGAGEERLNLVTPTAHPYAVGQAWSFMEAARLDQDAIELHHHTDSDGVMEISAGFHTFANTRDAAGSYFLPVPDAVKSPANCGTPIGLNPCADVSPWTYKLTFYHTNPAFFVGPNYIEGPCGLLFYDVPGHGAEIKTYGTYQSYTMELFNEGGPGPWKLSSNGDISSFDNCYVTITLQKRGEDPVTVIDNQYQNTGYFYYQWFWDFH